MTFQSNAIFWVETDRIVPNPYQPRREFDEVKLNELADSIRQYGVLQPLVVTRRDVYRDDGSMIAEYELIAGERRLRASRIAGIVQVPVIIREQDDERVKLEIAIIENVQREDLNPLDRARAFHRLAKDFGYKHTEIAKKIGRSREYVANSVRMLALPEEMQKALLESKISEGHTRPLLMLIDRPEEQQTLFKQIVLTKLPVRAAEFASRRIATERARKKEPLLSDDIVELEHRATESLGTRVSVLPGPSGGKIQIDFSSEDDVRQILTLLNSMNVAKLPDEARDSEHTNVSEISEAHDVYDENEPSTNTKRDDDSVFSVTDFTV